MEPDLGQLELAIDLSQQSLAIAREVGNHPDEGRLLGNLGVWYLAIGQSQQAINFYAQHQAITREIGDRRNEAYTGWNWGNQLAKLGRIEEAIPFLEFCVAFDREIGHAEAERHAGRILEELRRQLAEELARHPARRMTPFRVLRSWPEKATWCVTAVRVHKAPNQPLRLTAAA